ncbi:endonuclease/exonuclease/phosphatase family protein [Mycobacterium sp. MMS18-G62]
MGVVTIVGTVALAVAVVGLAARYTPGVIVAVVAIAALAPYLTLGAPLAMLLFAISGTWVGVAVAGAVTVASAAVQSRSHIRAPVESGVSVRLVSANLRYGRADPAAVVRIAQATNADILGVQELTLEKAELLSAHGLGELLPHRALRAREGPAGVGIWSRYPIDSVALDERFWLGLLTARIHLPRMHSPATVVVTHMSAPWPEPIDGWRTDLDRLATVLQEIAADPAGPIMVAADLNATRDNREFRRLLRNGFRDGAEQAGAGLTRTHPADILLPPVFAVDHVLTHGCVATSMQTLNLPRSDHRALVADVVVPWAATAR